ncbi:MAG: hypothetical protein FWF46_02430 [Oscillospiraceae bacterium]|nr:hypothetical protein [Oscillospiraceae bacterium]
MRKIFESEKGSVTLYTIITLTVVTIILVGIYFSIINKQKSDLEVSQQIKAIYENDVNNVDNIYNNVAVENNDDNTFGENNLGNPPDTTFTTVANAPDITGFNKATTYYVAWDTTSSPYAINDTTLISGTAPVNWYDYTAGVNHYANIKTTGGGNTCYWVWVPRYAYRINSANYHTSTSGTIDIKFLSGTTNTPIDGSSITIANASGAGNWNVSPGFWWDKNNDGIRTPDEELAGIWVAKYAASCSTVGVEPGFGGTPTSGTSYLAGLGGGAYTNQQVRSIPNVTMWRGINVNDIFTACRNMTNAGNSLASATGVDSHMIKNSEWGAVAYLSMSTYGKNGRVWMNPYYNDTTNYSTITGLAGETATSSQTTTTNLYEYNTTGGRNASTTGNVYGVYDMSGGAFEYVAAYLNQVAPLAGYTTLASAANKYKDVYAGTSTDPQTNYLANSGEYGDAMYETSDTGSYSTTGSWDSTDAQYPYSAEPVFLRAIHVRDGSRAGVFAFNYYPGDAYNSCGFRPCLVTGQQ